MNVLWSKISEIAPLTKQAARTESNAVTAPVPLSIDQLRVYWDKFSSKFDTDMSPTLAAVGHGMLAQLRLSTLRSLLANLLDLLSSFSSEIHSLVI
jgi:hypothetical protein